MDFHKEQLVKKKLDSKDYGVIIAVLAAFLITLLFVPVVAHYLRALSVFVYAFAAYGVYYLITGRSVEFEYTMTNSDIDIDKIIARRKRVRVKSFNIKDCLEFGKLNSNIAEGKKVIDASSSLNSGNVYYALLDGDGGREIVLFEPNEDILNQINQYKKFRRD